jgi:ABC-type multidrug transport system fused ATPase/permease subunit
MSSVNFVEMIRVARRLGISLRVMVSLIAIDLLGIAFEVIGISMLLPIFGLLRAGHDVQVDQLKGEYWEIVKTIFGFFGVQVSLGLLLGISFANILLRQILSYFSAWYNGRVRRRTSDRLRQRIFYQYLLAKSTLQDSSGTAEVMSIMKMDLSRGLNTLFTLIAYPSTVVRFLVYVGGLFLLSWPMTLLSLAAFGLGAFFVRGPLQQIRKGGTEFSTTNRQLNMFVMERLLHARLIRLSGTEKAEARSVYEFSRRNSEALLQQSLRSSRLTLVPEPLAVGFAYLVLFIGGHVLGFSLEVLGMFVVILIRLLPIVRGSISKYATVLGQMASLEKLDAYVRETQQAREPKGGNRTFKQVDRAIRYDRVSFSYSGVDVPALWDITVHIPAHRMTALVGPSGAGKSTFVDLLPRLRIPSSGEILIDDIPIQEYSVGSLRAGIAFVSQVPQIFNFTVSEHIRYGKDDATDEEVSEAARLAGALGFIEKLPNGFDTLLGENGFRLSGGQRQRLDIARALVRRAPILILDEPTSALDADAEFAFRDALKTLRVETNLTIIVIAHRLSTIADADHIVVLKNGRVEASGTHNALVAAGGWYANALRKQQIAAVELEQVPD